MYIFNYDRRRQTVFLFFFFLFFLCIVRLIQIQIFRSRYLVNIAYKQHNLFTEIEPVRGIIYDARLRPQTLNLPADSVYAVPKTMSSRERERTIAKLSEVLGLSPDYLRERLSRRKAFVWIKRKISSEEANALKKLELKHIGLLRENKRSYPNMYLASQIIGFAGLDNVGLEGIELYFDEYLRGTAGWGLFLRDGRQKKLDVYQKMVPPKDGLDIVLTIDQVIQYIAERELERAVEQYNARGGSVIVMEPFSGRILAMANRPTYDLNEYKNVSEEQKRNRAISDLFEPGSVFKIITAAAALEEKKISENDKIFCENGQYRIGNHILHDHISYGWLTFREVIEKSSNIGTVKVAQLIGPETLYRYIRLFGFGAKLGRDLPGEIAGIIKEPRFWSKTSIGAIPIGQEVGVTALQLASAFSVIANGGKLMRPYIVSEIRRKNGEIVKKNFPVLIREVISSETAAKLAKILTGVVEEGTGKLAQIEGITAAGKTGTAQKLEPNGTYSHRKFIASFVGFVPVENPLVTIVVSIDEPKSAYYGGTVAAPVFRNIAADVVKYLRLNNEDRRIY